MGCNCYKNFWHAFYNHVLCLGLEFSHVCTAVAVKAILLLTDISLEVSGDDINFIPLQIEMTEYKERTRLYAVVYNEV